MAGGEEFPKRRVLWKNKYIEYLLYKYPSKKEGREKGKEKTTGKGSALMAHDNIMESIVKFVKLI